MEPVQPVHLKNWQSNVYRKDLSSLRFDDEPKVQKRQQKDQQLHITIFAAYLTYSFSS